MIISVQQFMDTLCTRCREYFNDFPLKWKSIEDPAAFQTHDVTVFPYCVPTANTVAGAIPCPCVCFRLLSADSTTSALSMRLRANLCVQNASTSDAETAVPVEGKVNRYTFKTTTGYVSECAELDLMKYALHFTSEIDKFLNRISCNVLQISNIVITFPDADMPSFPYAESVIDFNAECRVLPASTMPDEIRRLL